MTEGVITIGAYEFRNVCRIQPVRTADDVIEEFMPQSRYRGADHVPLNRYGGGPFCKFKIPVGFSMCGVYALMSDRTVKYIGECENLSSRFNMGYGIISPRNCFRGGQETNCRINNLILEELKRGVALSLWFMPTADHKVIEQELRMSGRLDWNRV